MLRGEAIVIHTYELIYLQTRLGHTAPRAWVIFLLSGDSFMGCQGDKWLGQWTVSAAATIWAGRNMPHCPTHCPYTECSLFLLRMTAVKATQPGTHELCFP